MAAVQALTVLLCGSSTVRCLSGASNGNTSGIRKPEVVELPAGPGSGNHVLMALVPVMTLPCTCQRCSPTPLQDSAHLYCSQFSEMAPLCDVMRG